MLQLIATLCNTLQHTAAPESWGRSRARNAHCTATHTTTYCNTLQHITTYCKTLPRLSYGAGRGPSTRVSLQHALQHTLQHTLQHGATHCDILQHTAALALCSRLRVLDVYCTATYTASYCNILQHIATYCNTAPLLSHEADRAHANTQYKLDTATRCNTLQHTAAPKSLNTQYKLDRVRIVHCNMLQHTATRCNTLQHTTLAYKGLNTRYKLDWVRVLHCNTLHHTTTHCNT